MRSVRLRLVVSWLLILCATLTATEVVALAATVGEEPAKPTVEVVLAGADEPSGSALLATLERSLGRLGAQVAFRRVATMSAREVATAPRSTSAAVTIWIDLGTVTAASVYVTEGTNVFARRFDLGRPLDSVALDLLDVVVSSSVETVLAGRPLGVPREEFTRSLEPPPSARSEPKVEVAQPPPSVRPSIDFTAAAFYEGSLAGSTTPIDGPGLRIDARRGRLWVGLGVTGDLPSAVAGVGATIHLTSLALRLSVGHIFPVRYGLALAVALGAGVDLTRVRSESAQLDVTPAAEFLTKDVVVRPSAEIQRRSGKLSIGMMAALDIDPVGSTYVVQATPGTQPVWTPWRVRPVIALLIGRVF
jgi:hypothetical protein